MLASTLELTMVGQRMIHLAVQWEVQHVIYNVVCLQNCFKRVQIISPPFLSMYFCSLKVFLLVLKTIPMPSTVGLHVVTLMQTAVLPWLSHMLEAAAKAPVPTVLPQTVASFASRPWWTEGGQSGWTEPAACLVDQELWVRPERVTVLPRPTEAKIALEVTRTRCPVMMGPAQVQEAKILWNKLSIAM